MAASAEREIDAVEEQLRLAMLTSNIELLDKLLFPELIFTTHTGQVIGKQDDLAVHRSGALKFQTIEPSERRMIVDGQIAIVSVRMRLSGTYDGSPFENVFRFTRLWRHTEGNAWRIAAGQVTAVQ